MTKTEEAIAHHFQHDKTRVVYEADHDAQIEQWNWQMQKEVVTELEQQICTLMQQVYMGGECAVVKAIAGIFMDQKMELATLARMIVAKALGEPQHCEAYAILSRLLHSYFSTVKSSEQGKKAETFMHAVLDALQPEFEDLLLHPPAVPIEKPSVENPDLHSCPSSKMRAAVQFAGHLHRQGLLGTRVVSQMVHDLVGAGAVGCARELLRMIGVVLDTHERGNLEPVLEVSTDGEASSESEKPS